MAGLADAQQLEVNAAESLDQGLVMPAFGVEVFGQAVGQMRVSRVNIDLVKQVPVHVVAVRIGVCREQAHVLVQVERPAQRKIQSFLPMHPHQVAIDSLHGRSRRQTQHQVRIGPQFAGNNARDQQRGRLFVRLYNNFHGRDSTKSAPGWHQKKPAPLQRRRRAGPQATVMTPTSSSTAVWTREQNIVPSVTGRFHGSGARVGANPYEGNLRRISQPFSTYRRAGIRTFP